VKALSYLQHVGGFRLKGYYYHVLDQDKRFPSGYTFDQIAQAYEFDRQLRIITFSTITRLEISIRSAIANYLSLSHGPHWFLKYDIFQASAKWKHGMLVRQIEEDVGRSKNRPFIAHYDKNYADPYLPPSWGVAECVTFGMWSKTYSALKDANDQSDVFASWLHSLTVTRNTVAHHSRLLRHRYVAGPQNLRSTGIYFDDAHTFYAVATVINILLARTHLPCSWKIDLQSLFTSHPSVSLSDIGFPGDWASKAGWQE
jgi:abortive infection bacteriophage resistance protein